MNKKFLISWLVVFVVWMVGSMLVHGILLGEAYMALGDMMRSPEGQEQTFPVMLAAHIIMAGAFVWIYQHGAEDKPWLAQGVRFGIAIWLLAALPMYLIYYAVQPLPVNLVVKQIVFEGILLVVLGAVVALLNKPTTASDA